MKIQELESGLECGKWFSESFSLFTQCGTHLRSMQTMEFLHFNGSLKQVTGSKLPCRLKMEVIGILKK